MAKKKPKLKIMISSTVYGKEPLLDQVFAILTTFGYDVICSHTGTLLIDHNLGAMASCLKAVEDCDLMFCLISQNYGSGVADKDSLGICHQELLKAIELKKPRYTMAHANIVAARRVLKDLDLDPDAHKKLKLRRGASYISDIRLVDMYDAAVQDGIPVAERINNWVQEYKADQEVITFIKKQFRDRKRIAANLMAGAAKAGKKP